MIRLLGPDATPLDLRFTGPDGAAFPPAHLILVSNDPYQLDHLGGRGTREEALLMDPPLVFESRPGALRVRLPRSATGTSPAARTVRLLSGSAITELGRVVAGRPACPPLSSAGRRRAPP